MRARLDRGRRSGHRVGDEDDHRLGNRHGRHGVLARGRNPVRERERRRDLCTYVPGYKPKG